MTDEVTQNKGQHFKIEAVSGTQYLIEPAHIALEVLAKCDENGHYDVDMPTVTLNQGRVASVHYKGPFRDCYHTDTGDRVILTFDEYLRLGKPEEIAEKLTYSKVK